MQPAGCPLRTPQPAQLLPQGAADVQAVCCLAHNQLLAAQQGGAHDHAVALATALWQLLPLADQHLQAGVAGAAQQARILLLATQALLDLHSRQPDRWGAS